MKKQFLFLAISFILFYSCTPSKNVITFSKSQLKGSWTLSNIEYSKVGNYKSTLFDDASKECFEGSQWNLVANNNSGNYSLTTASDCQPLPKKIIWDVIQVDGKNYFQFKRLIEEVKAKNIQSGYRLNIDTVEANSIKMSQDTFVGNETIQLNYTFTKNIN